MYAIRAADATKVTLYKYESAVITYYNISCNLFFTDIYLFRFVHDRVQEAFYISMNKSSRRDTHLKIAQLLHKRAVEVKNFATFADYNKETLFTVAHNFNILFIFIITSITSMI